MTQLTLNTAWRTVANMPYVKLDCGILDSTLWFDEDASRIFITALLMAEPKEYTEPVPQIAVQSLAETGFSAPPDWYGYVPAAGIGIIQRSGIKNHANGFAALERLGEPEISSRSPEHGGRRLIRINGGYLVLNFQKYRDRDYTTAERSKRYRERLASRRDAVTSRRDITQAEAEAEAEAEESKPSSSNASRPTTLGEEYELAALLLKLIRVRNPEHKQPVMEGWAREIDRMIRLDNRKPAEIRRVIEWSQADHFWQNNILSPKKLREKFDQLVLQSKQQPAAKRGRTPVTGEDFTTVNR